MMIIAASSTAVLVMTKVLLNYAKMNLIFKDHTTIVARIEKQKGRKSKREFLYQIMVNVIQDCRTIQPVRIVNDILKVKKMGLSLMVIDASGFHEWGNVITNNGQYTKHGT